MSADEIGLAKDGGGDAGGGRFLNFKDIFTKTAAPADNAYSRRNKLVLETIPGAGPRIMETHEKLKKLADNMDVKVHDMLKEHEADFFLAYKTHMYGLQKEFKALKAKADAEDAKTRRDSTIQNLERELDWFMAEALRLDQLCKGYKKEVDKWKAKAEAIEEDRRYLEDQIKGSKRQNKVLRAAVERASYAAKYTARTKPPSPTKAQGEGALYLPPLKQRPNSADGSNEASGEDGGRQSAPPALTSDATFAAKSMSGQEQRVPSEEEQKLIDAVKSLRWHLTREQQQIKHIRAERADAYAKKSSLEEFFLLCIEESRKDLSRKRRPGGPKPQNEQERIRELLLSSEDVLVYLYERLFPHRAGMALEIQQQSGSVLA